MDDLNPEEIAVGYAFGLMWFYVIGWPVLFTAAFTALAWAMSGAGYPKLLRNLAVPAVIGISILGTNHNAQLLTVLLWVLACHGILRLGYGLPSTQPYDAGSWLGRIAHRITKNDTVATVIARGSIFAMAYLAYVMLVLVLG